MEKIRKNCHKYSNSIEDFIDYKLSTEQAYKLMKHCESCNDCIDEIKESILIRALMDKELDDDIDKQIIDEINYRIDDVYRKYYFYEIAQRNMKYFVVGSLIFILLSYIIDLIF